MTKAGHDGAPATSTPHELDASKLIVVPTTTPREKPPKETLKFGCTFSDHMVDVDWKAENGWAAPQIKPFEDIPFSPAALVFHYGQECFEGMKAYKGVDGRIRLFRPELNVQRLFRSCKRLALPTFDCKEMLELIKAFVKMDADWIPEGKGYSLYLRPTVVATEPTLIVAPTAMAKMFILGSPVGPYYKSGFAPVSLLADPKYVRAWPGGVGSFKCGGNYAPGLVVQMEASQRGYSQLLWLCGSEHQVTEVGTMNFFMLWHNKDGEKELVTAPLDGTILPGVTRDTVLTLCRQWGEFKVSETMFYMKDIVQAVEEGRVVEAFGSGTACIVCPIRNIGYQGKDYAIPMALGTSGELTKRLNDTILAIQYGEVPSEFTVLVE